MHSTATLRGIFFAGALGLVAFVRAAPISIPDELCRLRKVVLDGVIAAATAVPLRAASTADETESHAIWLCCPLNSDENDCQVLFGAATDALADADAGTVVSLIGTASTGTAPQRRAADVSELSPITRMAFGDALAVEPLAIHTANRRRLQTSSGASHIAHTSYWGNRTVLVAIVGEQLATDGTRATWPKPCTAENMRRLMFGALGGIPITVGPTPWSVRKECRDGTAPCTFNIRDQVLAISRSAVNIDSFASRFIFLPQARNWPSNYCGFYAARSSVIAALATYASYIDPDSFAHLLMIVPRHCALGQGDQPGRNMLASTCPGTGVRDNLGSIIMHEFGHNLGFGHSGTASAIGAKIGSYSDGTSEMGSSKGARPSTINLAHRHMFRWLPGLPYSLYENVNGQHGVVQIELRLADPGTQASLPAGAKWGAKIDDGAKSWYVGYRSCDGIDSRSHIALCGFIQISMRDGSDPAAQIVASINAVGQSTTFGQSVQVTVTALQDMPQRLDSPSGWVRVGVLVDRA